jgi:hypothetical protein
MVPDPRRFTLGRVQMGLRAGLPQADVADRPGSPNIVTRDADSCDACVHDKVPVEIEAWSSPPRQGNPLDVGRGALNRPPRAPWHAPCPGWQRVASDVRSPRA